MTKLRPFVLSVVSASAIVGLSATAEADGPARGYSMDGYSAPFRWSGFYMGVNGGAAFGQFSNSLSIANDPPGNVILLDSLAGVSATGSTDLSDTVFTGGVQAGYNFQTGRVVWGIELDFNSMRLDAAFGSNSFPNPTGTAAFALHENASTSWLFTARPRLGWTITDRTLIYATGGVAVTKLDFSQDFSNRLFPPLPPETASVSKTKVGWTVGGGLEAAIAERWTFKGEYLFTQFGSEEAAGVAATTVSAGGGPPTPLSATFNNSVKLDVHILRAGINYKF
jgi:outer membrane immunogenic protein